MHLNSNLSALYQICFFHVFSWCFIWRRNNCFTQEFTGRSFDRSFHLKLNCTKSRLHTNSFYTKKRSTRAEVLHTQKIRRKTLQSVTNVLAHSFYTQAFTHRDTQRILLIAAFTYSRFNTESFAHASMEPLSLKGNEKEKNKRHDELRQRM